MPVRELERSEWGGAEARLASALKLAAVPGDGGAEAEALGEDGICDPAGAPEQQRLIAGEVLLLQLGISGQERALGSGEAGLQGVEDGELGCCEQLVCGGGEVTHAGFSTSWSELETILPKRGLLIAGSARKRGRATPAV
jgi:hypothetical protein